jgi:CRP/FNR family transcriptional regulator, cyclic AMP receptor protein
MLRISSARAALPGQSQRMATAAAMTACTILSVDKQEMTRQLHAKPAFADRFLTHMLTRNIRIEEDLIDQLFNSSGRLARLTPLIARRRESVPDRGARYNPSR